MKYKTKNLKKSNNNNIKTKNKTINKQKPLRCLRTRPVFSVVISFNNTTTTKETMWVTGINKQLELQTQTSTIAVHCFSLLCFVFRHPKHQSTLSNRYYNTVSVLALSPYHLNISIDPKAYSRSHQHSPSPTRSWAKSDERVIFSQNGRRLPLSLIHI